MSREILAAKPPELLLRLEECAFIPGALKLRLAGPSWWEARARETSFIFSADGVREQLLRFDEPEVARVEIAGEDPLLWDFGPRSSIFGTAPLPDPYRFFLEFHRLVRDTLGIEREPVRYLNFRGSVGQWLEIVYSRSYGLLSAPAIVAEAATELLEAQVADYTVLPDEPGSTVPMTLLRVGESYVIAEHVEVEVEGEEG